MSKSYFVRFKIDARYETEVIADENMSLEDIKDMALHNYYDANFGDAEDIDSEIIIVEDDNGEFLYEA